MSSSSIVKINELKENINYQKKSQWNNLAKNGACPLFSIII